MWLALSGGGSATIALTATEVPHGMRHRWQFPVNDFLPLTGPIKIEVNEHDRAGPGGAAHDDVLIGFDWPPPFMRRRCAVRQGGALRRSHRLRQVMAPASPLPAIASARPAGSSWHRGVRVDARCRARNRSDPAERCTSPPGPAWIHHDFLAVASPGRRRALAAVHRRPQRLHVGVARLAPGSRPIDDLDLQAWAGDPINGASRSAAGAYALTATYRVDQPGAWSGSIVAGPVRLHV